MLSLIQFSDSSGEILTSSPTKRKLKKSLSTLAKSIMKNTLLRPNRKKRKSKEEKKSSSKREN
jgi:hypothetical protein